MKKLFLIIVLLFVLPVQSVYAMMKPADTITLDISNIPNDAVYIDVLFNFKNGENYTELDKDYVKRCGFDTAELAEYDEDDFVSFSCHYRGGNKADMHIKEGKTVFVGEEEFRRFKLNDNSLKLAVLDKNGHILQVSDPVKTDDPENSIYLVGDIKYDVGENRIDPDLFNNSGIRTENIPFFMGLLSFLIILLIALILILRKRKKKFAALKQQEKKQTTASILLDAALILLCVFDTGVLLLLSLPELFVILWFVLENALFVSLAIIAAIFIAVIIFAAKCVKAKAVQDTEKSGEAYISRKSVIILAVISAAMVAMLYIFVRFMLFSI